MLTLFFFCRTSRYTRASSCGILDANGSFKILQGKSVLKSFEWFWCTCPLLWMVFYPVTTQCSDNIVTTYRHCHVLSSHPAPAPVLNWQASVRAELSRLIVSSFLFLRFAHFWRWGQNPVWNIYKKRHLLLNINIFLVNWGKRIPFLPHQITVCFTETIGNTSSGKEEESA